MKIKIHINRSVVLKSVVITIMGICLQSNLNAQQTPVTFQNPILAGFNPDPSICRVGEYYYLVNSSFTCFSELPYSTPEIYLQAQVDSLNIQFNIGQSVDKMTPIGSLQSISVIGENTKLNRFNGAGIGLYVTSNNQKCSNIAQFDWFEYKSIETIPNK